MIRGQPRRLLGEVTQQRVYGLIQLMEGPVQTRIFLYMPVWWTAQRERLPENAAAKSFILGHGERIASRCSDMFIAWGDGTVWSEPDTFSTAPAQRSPVCFFGFLAIRKAWIIVSGETTLQQALESISGTRLFFVNVGDLVDTGQDDSQWGRPGFKAANGVIGRKTGYASVPVTTKHYTLGRSIFRSRKLFAYHFSAAGPMDRQGYNGRVYFL